MNKNTINITKVGLTIYYFSRILLYTSLFLATVNLGFSSLGSFSNQAWLIWKTKCGNPGTNYLNLQCTLYRGPTYVLGEQFRKI